MVPVCTEDRIFSSIQHPASGSGSDQAGGYLHVIRQLVAVKRTLASGFLLFWALACLAGCAVENEAVTEVTPLSEKGLKIAVWPIFNQSATPAPVENINRLLVNRLKLRGFNILDEQVLERVIAGNRIRYLGGLDELTAEAFSKEAGTQAVLITSLELYSDVPPPKIALTARLVSTGPRPQILWIDGVGMAGDDDIGLLELTLIEDPRTLLEMAVERLAASLSEFLSGRKDWVDTPSARNKFRPKVSFHSPVFAPDLKYRVVVVPFFNDSQRKNAGNIIALHFARQLRPQDGFDVIEPGIVRHALLRMRIIMGDGLSLADADLLFRRLNADLILTGRALDYQDYQGLNGTPKVDFSAQLIERRSREIVWKAKSFNTGDDGVFFFDWGRVNTAHAMASQMVQLAVQDLVE